MDFPYNGNMHRIDVYYESTKKPTPTHGAYTFKVQDQIPGLPKKFVISIDHNPQRGDFEIDSVFDETNLLYREIVAAAENHLTYGSCGYDCINSQRGEF
jgi:hypothetical protein